MGEKTGIVGITIFAIVIVAITLILSTTISTCQTKKAKFRIEEKEIQYRIDSLAVVSHGKRIERSGL